LFVSADKDIYIADTQNSRIVQFDDTGNFVRVIGPPSSDVEGVVPEDYVYKPQKLGIDPAGRIYVVVKNRYEGLVTFDDAGNFKGFVGAPKVNPSIWEMFWKFVSTDEQRSRRERFIPTLFTSIDVGPKGFLYTTVDSNSRNDVIRRLNLAGDDVLRREGFLPPMGDMPRVNHGEEDRIIRTTFVDISGYQYGTYSALDGINGKIFTYDVDGNLLFAFGTIGNQKGTFKDPVALEVYNENIYVLDRELGQLIVFEPTVYTRYILSALEYYNLGLFDHSTKMWQQVLRLNANYDLAYRWIATSHLRSDEFGRAMMYFRLSNYRKGYSEAFKYYRQEYIKENFIYLFLGLLLMIILLFKLLRINSRDREKMKGYKYIAAGKIEADDIKGKVKKQYYALRYALYVIFHPFDGFWDLKHEKRGTVTAATIILFVVCITFILVRQYTGFIINRNDLSELNVFMEMIGILVPFILWCIVNWSITTLMGGKGKFKEIYMTTAYALTPLTLIYLPMTVISNLLTYDEMAFYFLFTTIALIWAGLLIFFGMQTIHDYDMWKNTLASVFSIIGIGVVIFIMLLFFSVISKLNSFVVSVYTEIIFRY
ncbi:MAG: YIP1 family protein, partial [Halanaerobiales bacterium]